MKEKPFLSLERHTARQAAAASLLNAIGKAVIGAEIASVVVPEKPKVPLQEIRAGQGGGFSVPSGFMDMDTLSASGLVTSVEIKEEDIEFGEDLGEITVYPGPDGRTWRKAWRAYDSWQANLSHDREVFRPPTGSRKYPWHLRTEGWEPPRSKWARWLYAGQNPGMTGGSDSHQVRRYNADGSEADVPEDSGPYSAAQVRYMYGYGPTYGIGHPPGTESDADSDEPEVSGSHESDNLQSDTDASLSDGYAAAAEVVAMVDMDNSISWADSDDDSEGSKTSCTDAESNSDTSTQEGPKRMDEKVLLAPGERPDQTPGWKPVWDRPPEEPVWDRSGSLREP